MTVALFDFFRRGRPAAQPGKAADAGQYGQRFAVNPAAMFDIIATQELARLFRQSDRGAAWQQAFYTAAWNASVSQPEFPHFNGPDGMPYFRLDLPTANTSFSADCLSNLAQGCVDVNAGAAFFASADDPITAPQFVLSMGAIDALLRFGNPDGDPDDQPRDGATRPTSAITLAAGEAVLCATPSAHFLPGYTARALHRYMTLIWGISDPCVGLLVNARSQPARHLVIGRKASSFAGAEEAQQEMARLLWFMPPNRSLILMPEDWRLGDMDRLTDLFG